MICSSSIASDYVFISRPYLAAIFTKMSKELEMTICLRLVFQSLQRSAGVIMYSYAERTELPSKNIEKVIETYSTHKINNIRGHIVFRIESYFFIM
jgi:hypothetical protein